MYVNIQHTQKSRVDVVQFVHLYFVYKYDIFIIIELGGVTVAIKFKINVVDTLKQNGYTSYKIRKEKIMSESTLQKYRQGIMPSWECFNQLCGLLNCQPGDLIEYLPDKIHEK